MICSRNKTKTVTGFRQILLASAAAIAVVSTHGAAMAQGDEAKVYSIPPSDVGNALQAYSEQADVEIIYAEGDVEGKTTDGVDGAYSREAALEEIISDADLTYEVNDDGVVVIRSSFLDIKQASARSPEVRYMRASLSTTAQDAETITLEAERVDEKDDEGYSDVVIVTGTNIRGIAPESSPVRSFDREDIQMTGAATAQDFIQTLPQNFGGGSNASFNSLPNDQGSNFNIGQGSSVNLRGLGSGSTLVLLNGRRMAPSSSLGDFVDISLIPASAIERVDVLTDGASSIYGADAVAGVVNFVLRDDYDGAEASLRYGSVTEGNFDEFRANITGGKAWDTGNVLLAYEFFSRTNLSAEDRDFSQDAILPSDLLPSQRRHSVLFSGSQEAAPNLDLSVDFGYSNKDSIRESIPVATLVQGRSEASTENFNASVAGDWQVSESWFVDFSGGYSKVSVGAIFTEVLDARITGDVTSEADIWTADVLASGSLFSLPGGNVMIAVGGHYRSEGFESISTGTASRQLQADRDVYAVFGEAFIPIVGPDNALPGVHRLEFNVSGRYSDFSDFGSTANPKVGVLWAPIEDLRLRGSYSTSFNPPALGRSGALDTSGLAYPTGTINTLFGLTPGDPSIADVVGLAITGTSKDLGAEASRAFTGGVDYDKSWGRHQVSLSATYFDIEFEGRIGRTPVPENRRGFDVPNIAFVSPEVFPDGTILFNPSSDQINQVLNSLDRSPSLLFGADPLDAAFIDFSRLSRNLSLSFVRGVDFDFGYTFESDRGVYSLGMDGTFLDDFQQQAAVTTPVVELLNTQFNPVDFRLRGRAGYSHDGLSANVFVNYTDSYLVDNTPDATSIDSWTTVDLTLTYDTQERYGRTFLDNTVFRLSVRNLFDENPPSTPGFPSLGIFGFDPTNASPLNRFVSFEVTKRF